MYWKEWSVAQPSLIFGANACQNRQWFKTWKTLEHQLEVTEVIRNLPIKYPFCTCEELQMGSLTTECTEKNTQRAQRKIV